MENYSEIFESLFRKIKRSNNRENAFQVTKLFNHQLLLDVQSNIVNYAQVNK